MCKRTVAYVCLNCHAQFRQPQLLTVDMGKHGDVDMHCCPDCCSELITREDLTD
ncbi:MAG: hypothetical protein FWC33_02830 [Candidatus Bathyarchaeota archaeon]|nr:hypothetical protein [Candidatus Termiticorpusculum sp.]